MIDQNKVGAIISCLQAGGVIALPTETIYGLCCDPRNTRALEKLFEIKQRDPSKPVLCVTGHLQQIEQLVEMPFSIQKITKNYWPGPLTIIFPLRAKTTLAPQVISETKKIALRLSPDPLIKAITQSFRFPITATSSNISGMPFLLSAADIQTQFGGQLELIIETDHKLPQIPSTLIEYDTEKGITLIREGAIPWKEIEQLI